MSLSAHLVSECAFFFSNRFFLLSPRRSHIYLVEMQTPNLNDQQMWGGQCYQLASQAPGMMLTDDQDQLTLIARQDAPVHSLSQAGVIYWNDRIRPPIGLPCQLINAYHYIQIPSVYLHSLFHFLLL